MPIHDDLIGKTFGLWKIIDIYDDYIQPKTGWHKKRYLCECSCENKTIRPVLYSHLKNGSSTNCGCIRKEKIINKNKELKKKYNQYDLSGDYGIGYTENNEEFYFDLEDYDKIKDYYWYINKKGYVVTNINNEKFISLHALVLNRINANDDFEIDHIYGRESRNDSRKFNLRVCTHSDNMKNRGLQSNNKTGVTGVYFDDNIGKYIAYITVDKKRIYLGIFDSLIDAKRKREIFEIQYFKEYRYKNKGA